MSVATKRLNPFIEKIGKLKDLEAIKKACNSEKKALRRHYKNDNTFRSVISRYRNEIKEKLPSTCGDILKYFALGKGISERVNKSTRLKTALRKYQINEVSKNDILRVINKAIEVLSPTTQSRFGKTVERSYIEIALGLCLLTGRRPSEIFTGQFEAVSDNEILFNGQLKTKGSNNARHKYIIPVLCHSHKIINAIKEIRERVSFKAKTNKDIAAINNNVASSMSTKVGRIFRGIKGNIKASDLRKLYVSICYCLFCTSKKYDIDSYYALILGHSVSDTITASNYKMFSVSDLKIKDIYKEGFEMTLRHLEDMDKIQAEIKGMIERI